MNTVVDLVKQNTSHSLSNFGKQGQGMSTKLLDFNLKVQLAFFVGTFWRFMVYPCWCLLIGPFFRFPVDTFWYFLVALLVKFGRFLLLLALFGAFWLTLFVTFRLPLSDTVLESTKKFCNITKNYQK